MGYDFRLPDVGEGVAEAEIVQWLVSEGEVIEQDHPVVEVQTDKAVVELSSPVPGRVARKWSEGSMVPVGEILFVVGEEVLEVQHDPESFTQKTLMTSRTQPSDVKGEGCSFDVAVAVLSCNSEGEGVSEPEVTRHNVFTQKTNRALATPSVRRLAKEMGIDLQMIGGTGKDGRIMEEDLKKHLLVTSSATEVPPPITMSGMTATMVKETAPTLSTTQRVDERSLSPIRRVIGERLLYSVTHKPHAIHFDELDVEGLVAWRNRIKKDNITHITYTAILLKLVAYTLKQHMLLNAHFCEENQKIHLFQSLSIGIATDTPKGLLVPVIHEVEKKNMSQLGAEVNQLTELARSGKCPPEQMKGSTFTISNAGALGGKWAAPIINPPEVAILALHPIEQRPVVREGVVVPGWRMNVSLAFDHRVLDGADAIRFTQALERYTSDPGRLLHELI